MGKVVGFATRTGTVAILLVARLREAYPRQ